MIFSIYYHEFQLRLNGRLTGFPQALDNHGKPGKSLKTVPCMEKIMEFENP